MQTVEKVLIEKTLVKKKVRTILDIHLTSTVNRTSKV